MVVLTEGLRKRDIGRRMIEKYKEVVPKTFEQERLYGEFLTAWGEYDRAVEIAGGAVIMFSEGMSDKRRKWYIDRAEKIRNDPLCQRAKKSLDEARRAWHESMAA